MTIEQIRKMIIDCGGDPDYRVEFLVPSGGDWSNMTIDEWAVASVDRSNRIVTLTAR